jgi:hypothetical protein
MGPILLLRQELGILAASQVISRAGELAMIEVQRMALFPILLR